MKMPLVPELADGGYWYRVPSVLDSDGVRVPAGEWPAGFTAWYVGEDALVRVPDPAMAVGELPAEGWTGPRPYGRLGGR